MFLRKNKFSFERSRTKNLFLLFMAFATLLASSSALSYIVFFPDKTVEVTLGNAIKKNKERESVVKNFILDSTQFVSTLGNSETFKKYLKTNSKPSRQEFTFLTLNFLRSKSDIMQIRYIDKYGKEQVRVERANVHNSPFIVPEKKLQEKKDRYYFAKSKHKPLDKVWFSAIDLNIEKSKIQIPYVPTLRAILPVSSGGKFDGIIIVNYFLDAFLKKLLYMPLYDTILINEKGYPLVHYDDNKSWAFYKKDKFNILQQFPNTGDKILLNDVFTTTNYTSKKIDVPIQDGLILILKLKDSYLEKVNSQANSHNIALFVITFIFSIIFGLIVVKKFGEILDSLKDKNYALIEELYFDSLTKLKNRKSLMEDIDKMDAKCLLLIDIQAFSTINDLYGERVGDILLQKFSTFLLENTQECKTQIYRLHGNTFAILSVTKKEKHEYVNIINTLLKKLSANDFSFKYNGVVLNFVLNTKMGIATSENSSNLFENSDMALNYAKKMSKDFVVYNPDLGIEKIYEKDIEIIKTVKKALNSDRIVPYFQPIYKKDKIYYESLVRLVLEDGTVLSPFHFLDVTKKTRLYFELTQVMIEKSFKIFQHLPNDLSINLSYLDIKHADTIVFLKRMLKKYNIANRLIVEIVESDTFKDYESVVGFLDTLKGMGIRIAVDDFGSGYSNFSHLMKLYPDYIKIDGSLIKNIDTNEKSYAVTKTIASFAKDMNIRVVAEYIHSKAVYEKAKKLDLDGYQGYLLGEPQAAKDIFGDKIT